MHSTAHANRTAAGQGRLPRNARRRSYDERALIKIQHAEGVARAEESLHWLRHAARSMDRSQTTLRREDPDKALAVWEGLVTGRWSLIDRFDGDGRRYLVARRNDPEVQVSTALTRREQQLVSYAALGHANKFMAYELGISESNVSESIKQACTKLGVRSRTELIQLLGVTSQSSQAIPDLLRATRFHIGCHEYAVFSVNSVEGPAPVILTASERFVFHGVLAGQTNGEIAASRCRSVRTVANQVAGIFRKLEVHSRAELIARHAGGAQARG